MTMTRETKVGVVVCLSFLCLVGVVLGTKLRGDGTDEDELAKEEVIADSRPGAVGDNASPPAMRIPAQPGEPSSPPVISTSAVQNAQPLPPPPSSVAHEGKNGTAPQGPDSDLPPPLNNTEPTPTAAPSVVDIVGPYAGSSAVTNSSTGPKPTDIVKGPVWGGVRIQITPAGMVAVPATSSGVGTVSGLDDVQMQDGKQPGTPTSPVVKEQPGSASSSGESRGANPSETAAIASPAGASGSANPNNVRLNLTPPPPASLQVQPEGSPPGAVLLAPMPPSGVRPRAEGGSPGVVPNRSPLSPSAADTAPEPQPRSTPSVVPVSATENSRPIGAAPTATTPPITVPGPGAASSSRGAAPATPQVESWDEESYRIKAGDTFARISVAHYNTDNYAKALERFNVNHPQAGEHMRSDPPRLDPGQLVYIPPAYILEKRYGRALIPGYKPQPETATANDTPRTVNSSPRRESAADAPQKFKWYLVTQGGQMMRDIARTTLSDAGRWTDISKLNPTTDPSYAVPGGLLIKVPADARIPAANTPRADSR
jgi:hypothetical protein